MVNLFFWTFENLDYFSLMAFCYIEYYLGKLPWYSWVFEGRLVRGLGGVSKIFGFVSIAPFWGGSSSGFCCRFDWVCFWLKFLSDKLYRANFFRGMELHWLDFEDFMPESGRGVESVRDVIGNFGLLNISDCSRALI